MPQLHILPTCLHQNPESKANNSRVLHSYTYWTYRKKYDTLIGCTNSILVQYAPQQYSSTQLYSMLYTGFISWLLNVISIIMSKTRFKTIDLITQENILSATSNKMLDCRFLFQGNAKGMVLYYLLLKELSFIQQYFSYNFGCSSNGKMK